MDVNLFQNQYTSDKTVEEIANLLEVPRNSLNVFASSKGLIIGPLTFKKNGIIINCLETPHLLHPQSLYTGFH